MDGINNRHFRSNSHACQFCRLKYLTIAYYLSAACPCNLAFYAGLLAATGFGATLVTLNCRA
jgi:hypothetical protein